MSQTTIAQIRSRYPTPLQEQHLAFLQECARALSLGLVKKTNGSYIPHPTVGGVSQDVLMARPGQAWDILIDAENEARPAFNQIGTIAPSRYVDVATTEPPPPDQPSEPEPGDDVVSELIGIRRALEKLAAHFGVH